MWKFSATLLGFALMLAAFGASAQSAPQPAGQPAAKPAAPAAAAPATAPTAAEEAAKAERRARFDLRATEEGDKLNDVKKQIEALTAQNADANAKSTPEVQQQRQAVIDAYKALAQTRQELVGALKTYDQSAVTLKDADVQDAQFEVDMATRLLQTVQSQAGISGRIGDGALDPRVREAAKKVLDGEKADIQLQRELRQLQKKIADLQKVRQNNSDDLEIQILTIQKEQRANGETK